MSVEVGAKAPGFELENQFGEAVTLDDLLAEGPVVLVFFPLAFTGICTGELCELRDNLSLFQMADARVVAVSVDSKATLRQFAEREGYEFPLLADFWPHGAVAQRYGAFVEDRGIATRATFVIGRDGTVAAKFVTSPGEARDFDAYRRAIAALA